jgi:uncharacterized caspase-like protein
VAVEEAMKHLLTDIPGIGEGTAAKLAEHGITSVDALLRGGENKLGKVPGFGAVRVGKILAAAEALNKDESSVQKVSRQIKSGAQKAVVASEKAASQLKKGAEKAAKQAAKEARKLAKAAEKAEKEAKRLAKVAEKALKKAEKEAKKLAKTTQRKAKKVAKAAAKEARKATKSIKSKAKKK